MPQLKKKDKNSNFILYRTYGYMIWETGGGGGGRHVAHMGKKRHEYRILVRKSQPLVA
jgi:hypothetical protein